MDAAVLPAVPAVMDDPADFSANRHKNRIELHLCHKSAPLRVYIINTAEIELKGTSFVWK